MSLTSYRAAPSRAILLSYRPEGYLRTIVPSPVFAKGLALLQVVFFELKVFLLIVLEIGLF